MDDSVDPGRRLHCDHEKPSGAQPSAPHPAKLEIFRGHSFSRFYAALALGAVIACRFSCRNTPTQHLLVCHGLPGLIVHGRLRAIVGALYRLRKELSYTDELGVGRVQVSRWRERYCRLRPAGIERDLPRGASPSTVDVARLVELTTQCKPEAARHWSTRTMAAELGVSAASVSRGVHQRAGVGCRHPPACRPSKHQTKPFIWSKTAADILQKVIRATSWVDEKAQRVGACAPGGDRNAQHQGNTGQVRSPALVPKPPLRQRFLARLQT